MTRRPDNTPDLPAWAYGLIGLGLFLLGGALVFMVMVDSPCL